MKNRWKILDKRISKFFMAIAVTMCLMQPLQAGAATPEELDELEFKEMINAVDLGNTADLIRKFQDEEAKKRLREPYTVKYKGCNLENYRNKEILLITIPARLLFAPNESNLNKKAGEILSPIKRYFKNPDTYRVLLVMHTDNTGSPEYRDLITENRVNAIADWFDNQGLDTSYLFTYAMGDDMPLKDNDSQANRDANRRLEIYLVPGEKMVEQAKKGKIEF